MAVAICTLLCNLLRHLRGEETLITGKRAFMLWHAGLRGGIALTLVLQLNDWAENKAVLVVATFLVIAGLLCALGGSTDWALNLLSIERETPAAVEYKDLHAMSGGLHTDSLALSAAKTMHRG